MCESANPRSDQEPRLEVHKAKFVARTSAPVIEDVLSLVLALISDEG
jgi:hypothetical protein